MAADLDPTSVGRGFAAGAGGGVTAPDFEPGSSTCASGCGSASGCFGANGLPNARYPMYAPARTTALTTAATFGIVICCFMSHFYDGRSARLRLRAIRSSLPLNLQFPMIERFARLPGSLVQQSRTVVLEPGSVPTLLAHPDWKSRAPFVLWMHGRTANKELDPGRYTRWLRAGIAVCAIDLPGHGERFDKSLQGPDSTLRMLELAIADIDRVLGALAAPEYSALFDSARVGIGGMSAGGMAALRRLCDPHPFVCAAVEATSGSFASLPHYQDRHGAELVSRLDPKSHIATWRPIPLLALHSEADAWLPVEGIRTFTESLRERYAALGADPGMVQLTTWPSTGAPYEHLGFGRHSNEAKNLQAAFYAKHLF
jgi:dienelactone hydrolase